MGLFKNDAVPQQFLFVLFMCLDLTKIDNFIRKREASAPSRNLSELVADPAVFLIIHKHFARIISLGKIR
jgi:hypothetical protein